MKYKRNFRIIQIFLLLLQYKFELSMPQISAFYGLIILMNFKDHAPPHFHVWYGDYKVTITIQDGIVTGNMP